MSLIEPGLAMICRLAFTNSEGCRLRIRRRGAADAPLDRGLSRWPEIGFGEISAKPVSE